MPLVSNEPRLLAPRATATVDSKEDICLAPALTLSSFTAWLMKLVPKYIKVPAIAATLALEKNAYKNTQSPNRESP